MKSEEGYIAVPGGKVWYRSVGEGDVPLLCLHGGPGWTHNYIDPMADLAAHRRVIFYDQLGCGRSERPDDPSLWTLERAVEEVAAVREGLGLVRLHVFGSSWGGMLATSYVLDRNPHVESLITAGSPMSMTRFRAETAELRAALPEETQSILAWHEASGFTDCPEYQGALATFYKRHICRLDPWYEGLERSFSFTELGLQVWHTMYGPTEFLNTGNLKDFEILDRLGEIRVPTLITCGRFDSVGPAQSAEIQAHIPGAKLRVFDESSHCPFAEERDQYMVTVTEFLDAVESGGIEAW